jgi:dienelactone hydrolase
MLLVMVGTTLSARPQVWNRVRTALRHPMQYCVSLPTGWCPTRTWPVVVVIPDAARDFQGNLATFVKARGDRPFILVAPFVVTSGGGSYRDNPNFQYEVAVWREVDRVGDFGFDDAGVEAVLEDVRTRFRGQEKAFLTGWEAGGHTVWALLFHHPERWAGVAPVSPNFAGRWLGAGSWSKAPERTQVPVRVFFSGPLQGAENLPRATLLQQTHEALQQAVARGFAPIPVQVLPKQPHGPQADAVLGWFQALARP